MSWTQSYQASFAKPLVNQLIAIIQRDQAGALAVINSARAAAGNQALSPITEIHKGATSRTGWPWLYLETGPTNFSRGDDKATRHAEVRINLILDTGQFDLEMAQEDAQDYARMLDMIVSSAGPWPALGDWTTSLPIQHETLSTGSTVPNGVGTVNDVFIESHVPGPAPAAGMDVPMMRITVTVLFELEET